MKRGAHMAHCANCGIEIPSEDKTRLCDRCKKIILPFIKFMDVSTSSSVRRLVSNERNLRNAGVTDSGMDYLFRVCELHDKKKAQEKQARDEAKRIREQNELPRQPEPISDNREVYAEVELPMEEPLDFCRKPYGGLLAAAMAVLVIIGAVLLAMCAVKLVLASEFDVVSLAAGIGSFFSAYVAYAVKKVIRDLEEVKKYFR